MKAVLALGLAALTAAAGQQPSHLRVEGTEFVRPDGAPFDWRGITAFRLVELVAHGKEREADDYLAWAASKKLTLVRVLAMAGGIFRLTPAEGVRALPRLLDLAQKHGLFVEVVALASTGEYTFDLQAHVRDVARICAEHPNAVLELANEPGHRSQVAFVHDPEQMQRLAATLPREVPMSLGSVEYDQRFAGGSYVTWHAPRRPGWEHALIVAGGAELIQRFRKPVVSDEPIGAGDRLEQGRRDNAPERFRTLALVSRLAGLGATFHYNGGIQAARPSVTELACLDAWADGLDTVPRDAGTAGTFRRANATDPIVAFDSGQVAAVFVRATDTSAWVLGVGVQGHPQLRARAPWRQLTLKQWPGVQLIQARRNQ
jgi:hypothetical protein